MTLLVDGLIHWPLVVPHTWLVVQVNVETLHLARVRSDEDVRQREGEACRLEGKGGSERTYLCMCVSMCLLLREREREREREKKKKEREKKKRKESILLTTVVQTRHWNEEEEKRRQRKKE